MRISLFTLDTANVMDLTRNIASGLPLQVLHGEMTDRIQTSTINNPLFFQLQHSQPPKKSKEKESLSAGKFRQNLQEVEIIGMTIPT